MLRHRGEGVSSVVGQIDRSRTPTRICAIDGGYQSSHVSIGNVENIFSDRNRQARAVGVIISIRPKAHDEIESFTGNEIACEAKRHLTPKSVYVSGD